MDGLTFTSTIPSVTDPARMDIACFIGYVGRRPVDPPEDRARRPEETDQHYLERLLPAWLCTWFKEFDWRPGYANRTVDDFIDLIDVPVPIDTWETFERLFLWNQRPLDASGRTCDTAMGAAVRRFFAQGGRNCYIIRLGDPWMVMAPAEERAAGAAAYIPTLPPPSPVDRSSWHGLGHLFGLSDVSFLCLPDLPEVFSTPPSSLTLRPADVPREQFIECADRIEPPGPRSLRSIPPPSCDENGFLLWANLVNSIAGFVDRYAPQALPFLQVIAAIPLPVDERSLGGRPDAHRTIRAAREAQWRQARSIHSRYVQLVYPWLRTRTAGMLPGALEAPDAMLAGLLSDNALSRATWHSAVRKPVAGVSAVEPVLDRATLLRDFPTPTHTSTRLRDRVSVIGPAPGGFLLLSDVTTAGGFRGGFENEEGYRPANVYRLLAALFRAARLLGENVVFENNGAVLWRRLRERLENFLTGLWADGALAGTSAREAFEVRCDRTTMTQADLDAGRVIVRMAFTAAMPIVHITVVLAMDEGGRVSLVARPLESAA